MKFEHDKELTVKEVFGPMIHINDHDEFKKYFDDCVKYAIDRFGIDRDEATVTTIENIIVYYGHFDNETYYRICAFVDRLMPVSGISNLKYWGLKGVTRGLKEGEIVNIDAGSGHFESKILGIKGD